jgi:bifunctional UDP-N-acetylglucosamine pyrophosphorylase / glucosamine-1-phosphate N-acetyltransferase
MTERSCLAVILAAGEGTRMKSDIPKVLHPVGGLPMVAHTVRAASAAGVGAVALVVGRGADQVEAAARPFAKNVSVHVQTQRLGTAHAVLAARAAIARGYDDVLVMFGDTPLIDADALSKARARLAAGADIVVMGFRPADPTGYGRLVEHDHKLFAIVEDKDADADQKKIGYCNGGLMAISGKVALSLLDAVGNKNSKGEYYLTDIVAIAHGRGLHLYSIEVDSASVLGVNTRVELAEVEGLFQDKVRKKMMLDGVSMIAPETIFFTWDTKIGPESTIEPNVFFGPDVTVEGGVTIHAFCHIEGAKIASGSQIGPFARLRPGADLRANAKAGNFVEIKNSVIGEGAKVNHLTYVGDAVIGAKANIGAGTITCNYDGYNKYQTIIGEGAFIGSNSALVAPVSVGANAIVAAGSVITKNVPDGAVAFGRAKQETREGRASALHARNKAIKEARKAK